MEEKIHETFFINVFKSLRFRCFFSKMEPFKNDVFAKD